MGYQDRDWYKDHHREQRAGKAPYVGQKYRRIPHRLSPWTLFFARAILAILALWLLAYALRWLIRH